MKAVILTKQEFNENSEQIKKVKNELSKNNIDILPFGSNIEDGDIVIAVGGDGTIFHAASEAMWKDKPVLGINAGRLGFLAQLELEDLSLLKKLACKEYTVDKRLVLKISLNDNVYYAVNDFVISSSGFGRVHDIDLKCNDSLVGSYRCDGLIFSTPTGSTAYTVSAGGPITDPNIDCFIITPIASHSLISRSIVISDKNILTVNSPSDFGSDFNLVCDGILVGKLSKGTDTIKIERAEVCSYFINIKGKGFYDTLNEKMKRRG